MFGFWKGLYAKLLPSSGIEFANGILYTYGSGSPEGVVTAPVGSVYVNTANGTVFSKTSGVGNTGWVSVAGAFAGFANGTLGAPGAFFSSESDVGWYYASPEVTFAGDGIPWFAISKTSGQIRAGVNSTIGVDYGALYPGFLARAWVNFNGVPISGTYSRTGTLVTVSITGHGLSNGMATSLDFTTGTATDGTYFVTVIDANTFTVTDTASGTTSGNVTANTRIRAGGNVINVVRNTTGDYTITMSSAMPDEHYATMLSGQRNSGASAGFVNLKLATAPTTTSFTIITSDTAGGAIDYSIVNVAVFR